MGINRTQFNRYLSSESFPRPDVLHRICVFFEVDARILLEPVDEIAPTAPDLLSHPIVREFLGNGTEFVDEKDFPSGFFRFTRPSFTDKSLFVVGLVYVFRRDGYTFLRGYEPKAAMRMQGLGIGPVTREFRAILMRQEEGVAALVARHKALTCSFNFFSRVSSFENNFWDGYATRTVRESVNSMRATRLVYEHIQGNRSAIFETARSGGMKRQDQIHPYHARLLNLDTSFR
ncbi:XRE family transcriptional regulator [Aquicoccus sp. G2-2]|uniref:XRE family transcriptional regulator n=1 Tax=Aquicoccus sp. G2-2 TaxID=3092120 RepID=UPI002AE01CF1|nr:XRE family transcriptional regulator [Aquicoccus sp. G2-2]MEA1112782.1 XRE family transcriptional regulator [Aquicoccus sp. G2-2]